MSFFYSAVAASASGASASASGASASASASSVVPDHGGNLADQIMNEQFEELLKTYFSKDPRRTKLFSQDEYAAYVSDKEAAKLAASNPLCTYYQVVTGYEEISMVMAICGLPWYIAEDVEEEGYGARRQCQACAGRKRRYSALPAADDSDDESGEGEHDDQRDEEIADSDGDSPNRRALRRQAHASMLKQAKRMSKGKSGAELPAGSVVKLSVPKVDRAPCDPANIVGVVLEPAKQFKHRIGFACGVLNQTICGADLQHLPDQHPAQHGLQFVLQNYRTMPKVTLRHAAASVSVTGGQGKTICHCKGTCTSNMFSCLKAGIKCTSACHRNNCDCRNK